jgi:transposase-like protein
MERYPKNITEFDAWFKTEQDCRQYLFEMRWPDGFICPRCRSIKYWSSDRKLYVCTICEFQISLTAGTIFHRSRKPLRLWFNAIWHITSQKYGANALGLMRILQLGSYHTAWEWLHKLRRAMIRPGRDKLKGVVEIDETYIGGKRTGKAGRGAEGKQLVIIAVEDTSEGKKKKGIGRIRLRRIVDASGESLFNFIKDNIEMGSTVRTDCWTGYTGIEKEGYRHKAVYGFSSIGKDLLPLTHLVASLLKRWLLGTYQGAAQQEYLDYYLDEYTFRFNRRKSASRGKLFYRLIEQSVAVSPVYARNFQEK